MRGTSFSCSPNPAGKRDQRLEARIRHRAISGMAMGGNDAAEIMAIVYSLSSIKQRALVGYDFNALRLKALSSLRPGQDIGSSKGRAPALHAGDHVRTVKPVGFSQIGGGVVGRMVRMRMVKADDAFTAVSGQLKRGNNLFRINAVTIGRRVCPHVLAGQRHGDPPMSARDGP